MAVSVVRAMLMMTLHLFFDSLVMIVGGFIVYVVVFNLLINVGIDAKDTSAVDEDLGKDI